MGMAMTCAVVGLLQHYGHVPFRIPMLLVVSWGAVCLIFAANCYVRRCLLHSPFRYVERGVPIVAKVASIALKPKSFDKGNPVTHVFVATIKYVDPTSKRLKRTRCESEEFLSIGVDRLTTSFQPGDYVTAIYLPDVPKKTLRLYSFLDLRPDTGIVQRSEIDPVRYYGHKAKSVACLLSVILLVLCCIIAFCSLSEAARVREPIAIPAPQEAAAWIVGAALSSSAIFFGWRWLRLRRWLKRVDNSCELGGTDTTTKASRVAGAQSSDWEFGVVFGVCAFAFVVVGGLCLRDATVVANARLDISAPVAGNIVIRDFHVRPPSYGGFTLVFERDGDDRLHRLPISTRQREQLTRGPAIALVREGRFGWPWVESFEQPAKGR